MSGTPIDLHLVRSTSTYICGVLERKAVKSADEARRSVRRSATIASARFLELAEPEVGPVADHHLEAAGVAEAVDWRRREHGHRGALDSAEALGPQLRPDRVGRSSGSCRLWNSSSTTNIVPKFEPFAF